MAFTVAGFWEQGADAITGTNITAVADDHLKNEGDAIIVPELSRLIGFHAGGDSLANIQIVSPSLRRTCLMDVSPVDALALPTSPPDPLFPRGGAPTLEFDEEVTINGDYGNDTTPVDTAALLMLGDNNINPVSGQMFTVKGTLAGAGVAGSWKSVTMTLTQSLPVGNYKIVGARCEGAASYAFRFIFIGGVWRPGGICVANDHAKDVPHTRYGQLGVWGSFAHNREPIIEVLNVDATTAPTAIYLDIMRA